MKIVKSINTDGLNLIKQSEGLKLKAYKDSIGKLTIGYGHTGSDVVEGKIISNEEADRLLRADLTTSETGVNGCVTFTGLTDNQFSALVCFAFNLGVGNLKASTLLKLLNAGNPSAAADEFLKWNKAGGQILAGLTTRRQNERQLFLKP